MKKRWNSKNSIKLLIISMCLLLTGCGTIGLAREATFESAYENVPEEEPVNIFTSASYGVIQDVNTEDFAVTLYLVDRKEERTLFYDTATTVQDRYGSSLTMEQLALGEVVDITYNSELEKLGSVMLSQDGFSYDGISNYSFDEEKRTVQIIGETFELSSNPIVFSGDQKVEINQILKGDIISLKGIGREIVSITVNNGHGYLHLTNHEALIGGWIEIGQTSIYRIEENMLLTVPEGDYRVRLTADNIEEYRDITIERNKETTIDLESIAVDKPETGMVSFSVFPREAKVFINDDEIDPSYTLRMPLGIYKVTVAAEDYDSKSEYFEVTEGKTTVKISLNEAEEISVSGNKAEENGATITIQMPEGAEVYQDNLYMGIAPLTYVKTAGTHSITLRKPGYVTSSYQIVIADDDKDVYYSFPNLEPEKESSTVSGNSTSETSKKVNEAAATPSPTVSGNNATSTGSQETVSGNGQTVSGNN